MPRIFTLVGSSPPYPCLSTLSRQAGDIQVSGKGGIRVIDTTTDAGGYILGILWGSMSIWEEGFWLRHRDRWYIDTVRDYLGITAAVQVIAGNTGPQYRVKIVRAEWVGKISALLESHGWQPRMAQARPYPFGSLNDRGFCRAWVELHSSADIRPAWNRKRTIQYPQKRLRIYGNWALLEEMNHIFSSATGLKPRTLQRTSNDITKVLYFHGSSVAPVVSWLYDKAEIWNLAAREQIEFKEE